MSYVSQKMSYVFQKNVLDNMFGKNISVFFNKIKMKYTIGLDYGTDSVRALIVNALTGEEVSTAVFYYPRWKKGLYCDPSVSQYRQHPLDYLEGLEAAIKQALKKAGKEIAQNVVGISVDTTGSTPVAVDKNGAPLSLLPEFADNPNGMFILWKDHTGNAEALEINELAHRWTVDFTKYVGGMLLKKLLKKKLKK